MVCWTCHEPVGGPVCVGCGAIQPPRTADLFEILGLQRRFSITAAEVDRAWRAASRKVHPDRFAGRKAVERHMALQWTATINDARRILRAPRTRACYLATGEATLSEEGGATVEADFLEEMFELQMEAKIDPEATRPRIAQRREAAEGALAAIFTSWEHDAGDLETVPALLAQLKYLDNAWALVS